MTRHPSDRPPGWEAGVHRGHDLPSAPATALRDDEESDEESEYVDTISNAFLALRGAGLFLSPRDMAIILQWRDAGVPVATILRGMARGAERLHGRNQPIRSLAGLRRYVDGARRKEAPRFRRAHVGPGRGGGEDQDDAKYDKIVSLITTQIAALDALPERADGEPEGIAAAIRAAREDLEQVRDQAGGRSLEWAAATLLEVGRKFYQRVLDALPAEERQDLADRARRAVRGLSGSMSEGALASTLEELMIALLRERYGLFVPANILDLWDS